MARPVWQALQGKAVIWRLQKQPARAIECLLQAIELTRSSPELASETGTMLNYLADIYLKEGQLVQAEEAIRGALSIHHGQSGPEHTFAADDLMILSRILHRQARHEEAYDAGKKALPIFRRRSDMGKELFAQLKGEVDELRRKLPKATGKNRLFSIFFKLAGIQKP